MAAIHESRSALVQFYAGKSVFVTGATGFMGKVLVERLLATCPDIGKIYLLMRTKRELTPEQRLHQLKTSQAFEVLQKTNPAQLDKLCIIPGDLSLPGLGITQEYLVKLQEVSIVFHSAATVKFDEELKKAVEQNVLSVVRLLDICDRLPKMQAFVHVSSAYSNAERSVVEEKVYPPPIPLEHLMKLLNEDSHDLSDAKKFIHPKPNSYTFTKAMAECVVQQHGNRGYASAIFRPTIVISSLRHPFPGWIENLNGPSGVVVGMGKGLLHVFRCRGSALADMVPVDIAIDTLIAVAWETAVDKSLTTRVYNCSVSENPTTWENFRQALTKHTRSQPQAGLVWYPFLTVVENRYAHKALELLLQTVPLHVAEYTTYLLGYQKRPGFITASQRLKSMNEALQYFALREWTFRGDNVWRLRERLQPTDRRIYNLDPKTIQWDEHYSNFVKGVRKYLLREREQDQDVAKRKLNRMCVLHYGVSILLPVLLLRSITKKKQRQYIFRTIIFMFNLLNAIYINTVNSLGYICRLTGISSNKALSIS